MTRAGQLGLAASAAPLALSLAGAGDATATGARDYRALVCVFLQGGNDYANTLVPYDRPNYRHYARIRGGMPSEGGIAIARDRLTATVLRPSDDQVLTDDLRYALHPNLRATKALFDGGRAAIVLNVGPLITPLTRAQYESANKALHPLPPKLFSHIDQEIAWQIADPADKHEGWGGRLGDLAMDANGQSSLTCISAAGHAVFVSGRHAHPYKIGPSGAIALQALNDTRGASSAIADALRAVTTGSSSHPLEDEFAKVTRRSIDMERVVNGALANVELETAWPGAGNNPLARQLQSVARLIAARDVLGMRRQVFFVSLPGFDNHDGLMKHHPMLMSRLDDAVASFHQAIVKLGLDDQVTLFTASDFGRALAPNADGSDHGWGGHHFVIGGAVRGARFYGRAPHVSITSDDQVGQGRLLPSTAVDEYAATLARWFGASDRDLLDIFPNIGNFSNTAMGFV
ncbi:MAG: DUF1501 domain-containing protein [Alphaproteobacteria bacterium]